MKKQEIHQWDEIYPDIPTITEDIKKNQMYLGIIDNKIAVCFVLSEECDEEYKNGKWNYPDSKFCVIHRLCVNPEFQNQGIASKTLENILKKSVKKQDMIQFVWIVLQTILIHKNSIIKLDTT